ncbi:DUF6364 family protein [Mucilaginibacter sp.]|uniref:DUF6364 family protein n=1 Tax=Mucilaginibacter sp. TaxID=1882438 RepID=UPI003B005F3C
MKSRVNLTIEQNLLSEIKSYAAEKQVSISELVEEYFKQLAKPKKKSKIFDMVKNLDIKEKFDSIPDLKKAYYEDNAAKYGF